MPTKSEMIDAINNVIGEINTKFDAVAEVLKIMNGALKDIIERVEKLEKPISKPKKNVSGKNPKRSK